MKCERLHGDLVATGPGTCGHDPARHIVEGRTSIPQPSRGGNDLSLERFCDTCCPACHPGRLTDLELVQALGREECRCGAYKKGGLSLCGKCYRALPLDLQRALYARLGRGYREAYEAACAFLDDAKEN